MNQNLQLTALILGCAGTLIVFIRRRRSIAWKPGQAYHFLCGSAILIVVLVAAAVILSACDPYQGLHPDATPTAVLATTQPVTQRPSIPGSTPRPSCTVTTGVPSGYLNIRSGAGVQYPVIGLLQEGDVLQIITRGAWLEVETSQHLTGWVNSRYCKE